MPEPTDEELLDFDTSRMANWNAERATALLEEQRELYRNHLVVARWIWGWADRLEEEDEEEDPERPEGLEGYVRALREVATHLRQGDLLPTGILYEAELLAEDD